MIIVFNNRERFLLLLWGKDTEVINWCVDNIFIICRSPRKGSYLVSLTNWACTKWFAIYCALDDFSNIWCYQKICFWSCPGETCNGLIRCPHQGSGSKGKVHPCAPGIRRGIQHSGFYVFWKEVSRTNRTEIRVISKANPVWGIESIAIVIIIVVRNWFVKASRLMTHLYWRCKEYRKSLRSL